MKKSIEDLLKQHKRKYKDQITYYNDIELVIDSVCKELSIPKVVAKKIVDAQFRMMKQVMGSEGLITKDSIFEDFKSIRLLRLGSFRPSQKKFEYIQKNLKN